jgi:hypothetical protein
MQIREYTRRTFAVNAVEVTLENYQDVAKWCKGSISMEPAKVLGTTTMLPAIKIQGHGDNRGKEFTATLGCFVVELKGSYRVYKPGQFNASFEEKVAHETLESLEKKYNNQYDPDSAVTSPEDDYENNTQVESPYSCNV